MFRTHRLHTRTEWQTVRQRWQAVQFAHTLPLWQRQPPEAWPWPLRGPVWLWTYLPLVVYTALRWAPFLYGVGVIQAGGFAAADRDLAAVPADIVRGIVRFTQYPAHSSLVLWTTLVPWGVPALVVSVYVAYGTFDILFWAECWTFLWGGIWLRLLRTWMGWWAGRAPSLVTDRDPASSPVDRVQALRFPDWVDYQMDREAQYLGLTWRPPRLRPKEDA